MNYPLLRSQLLKMGSDSLAAGDPVQTSQIQSLLSLLNNIKPQSNLNNVGTTNDATEQDVVEQPDVNQNKPKDNTDRLLMKAMPSINDHKDDDALVHTFGKVAKLSILDKLKKVASAYVRDVELSTLSPDVIEDIERFIPVKKGMKGVEYGMVVDELLPKVDDHNFDNALSHVKGYKNKKEFYEKAKNKYILLMNDKIVDGHHFLAKAKELGVSNSLKVLDLTPTRFQEKKSSLLDALKNKYGNHSR